ncbi:PAS domain-containing protein [Phenylobacterium sp. J426]|uniref:sensor histidine kinase n=1 Tax=Phenylobacterium sp. J426 TaxID=2898439 RepID=UPI0021513539|nr:HWE histidine kinase domain-containing protein [Phenylobacterium sp. J426]MCR5876218.1 PAS domain-containing protein [Phenylobacterium sp. J426]
MSALDAGGVGYWELTLPEMSLQTSPRARAIFGRRPDATFSYADLLASLSEEDRLRRPELLAAAAAPGAIHDVEHAIRLPDGLTRWVNIRGRVVQRRGEAPRRMVGVVLDITDRRRAFEGLADAERRQRLLIDELNHRVKNTLAAVQSIARQSARGAVSVPDFRAAFESRLMALSQTHNALTRSSWEHAGLQELLQEELSPYAAGQCHLDGPQVLLRPREALALGMTFHELATNAAKYGALSTPEGRLEVVWGVNAAGRLALLWRERGGPPAKSPAREGFGTRLLRAAVDGELGGRSQMSYAPEGLTVTLTVQLIEPIAAAAASSATHPAHAPAATG